MSKESKEFEEKRRWLKTYKVRYNEVTYSREEGVGLIERERYVVARNFLDCLAKTETLHKCNTKDLLEISYQNTAMEIDDNS